MPDLGNTFEVEFARNLGKPDPEAHFQEHSNQKLPTWFVGYVGKGERTAIEDKHSAEVSPKVLVTLSCVHFRCENFDLKIGIRLIESLPAHC